MSGSRFPWFPVVVLAAATVWAAGGSGAAPSREAARGWDVPAILAQVTPPGGEDEGGEDGADEEIDPADTLDAQEGEPLTPDTTRTPPAIPPTAPADTPSAAAPETLRAASPDTASADTTARTPAFTPTTTDSAAAARRRAAAADSGVGDTLFMAKPRLQAAPGKQPPASAPEAKKPRSGLLGIHPIAILVGLAALHYFVVKTAGD